MCQGKAGDVVTFSRTASRRPNHAFLNDLHALVGFGLRPDFIPRIPVFLDFTEGNALEFGLTVEDRAEVDVILELGGDFHPAVLVFDD